MLYVTLDVFMAKNKDFYTTSFNVAVVSLLVTLASLFSFKAWKYEEILS